MRAWKPQMLAEPVVQRHLERLAEVGWRVLAPERGHRACGDAGPLFVAAAVADWRPKRRLAGKWREEDDGSETATIELVRNPDILATVARSKGERLIVGFALETGDGLRRARGKLERKNLDYVVPDDASALNAERSSVTVLGRDGSERRISGSKDEIARELVALMPA